MKRFRQIRYVCGALLAGLLLLAGCEQADGWSDGGEVIPAGDPVRLSFSFAVPGSGFPATRAAGGEAGDGSDWGMDYECRVDNLTVFLYEGTVTDANGINSTDADMIPLLTALYYDRKNEGEISEPTTDADGCYVYETDSTLIPESRLVKGKTYDLLVLANFGTSVAEKMQGKTLADLRDYVLEADGDEGSAPGGIAWDEEQITTDTPTEEADDEPPAHAAKKRYSCFRMVSAGRSTVRDCVTINHTADEPEGANVNRSNRVQLERLAVRVDALHKATGYEVENRQAVITIDGVALINNLTRGCYLFKRVADNYENRTALTYLGAETEANWVVDAFPTNEKGHEVFYQPTHFHNLVNNAGFESLVSECDGSITASDGKNWHRVGYTLENVNPASSEQDLEDRATGVIFRARYVKKNFNDGTDDAGRTFFQFGDQLYKTLSEAMKAQAGDNWQTGMPGNSLSSNGSNTWQACATYAAGLKTNCTGYRDYLDSLVIAHRTDASAAIPADVPVTWTDFMEARYSYKESEGKVDLSGATMANRRLLATKGYVRTYLNGYCYYTWWIKHNEDGNAAAYGPMEYAVVRNNVYRLEVTKIAGLGEDIPGEDSANLFVTVKQWNKAGEDNITLWPKTNEPD